MTRERGFALLMVLWTMGLLSLLVAQLTTTGRTEIRVAANMRANATAEAAADGAVHQAILRLLQGSWIPDGRVHAIGTMDAKIEVRVRNQAWKLNPNTASAESMQALLRALGVETGKAASLARAVIEWRSASPRSPAGREKITRYQAAGLLYGPANQLFESVDEIALVMGMTPGLLTRMKPFLSVYQEGDAVEPEAGNAPAAVIEPAMTDGGGWHLGSTGRVMVVMVDATAVSSDGGRFARQAVVRLRAEPSVDQAPYQILTWETVSGSPCDTAAQGLQIIPSCPPLPPGPGEQRS